VEETPDPGPPIAQCGRETQINGTGNCNRTDRRGSDAVTIMVEAPVRQGYRWLRYPIVRPI
jgi:hypothetical protein